MKIYTRNGDHGKTQLVNGAPVSKSDLRLDCYGTVDELNAVIGIVLSQMDSHGFDGIKRFLSLTQNQLFNLGSQLACPDTEMAKALPQITLAHVQRIEEEIDELNQSLPPLKQFILPGGHELASFAHLARTVCRRAERLCCDLNQHSPLPEPLIAYLNRLNDYFFVLARYFNHALGIPEITWTK